MATDERKHLWSRVGKSILLMMKTRAVVVKKDEYGKRVYELRESVRGTSENIQDLELAVGLACQASF